VRKSPFAGIAVLAAAAAVVSCAPNAAPPAKLPSVAPLAKPSLPPWIASISPVGNAESLAQIRVIFAKPVAKVEALSGAGPADVLSHVSLDPALKGRFVLLTPRMIGFVAEQAIPIGTRVAVKVSAGLRDLDGDALAKDLAWTFQTDDLELSDLPQWDSKQNDDNASPAPVGTQPVMKITANAAVDAASLASHATLQAAGENVPVSATLEAQPTPYPGGGAEELFDPSLKNWIYDLKPQHDLKTSTTYALTIAPGVEPAYGNVATKDQYTGAIHTYDALAVEPTPAATAAPGSGTRFASGDPAIAFNNPLDPKSIAAAVTVSPAPANVKSLITLSDDGRTLSIDPYALDPDAAYAATLSPSIKDVFGQALGRAQTITIRTSDFAPGAWSPSGWSVIPAGLPVQLNFYATNLPRNAYQAAYARVAPQDLMRSLDAMQYLPDYKGWPQHALAARRNEQSVVHVPLQAQLGTPYGALAYGFRTGLDPDDSNPGFTGIAQITNLGIFAQWFPQRGIVLTQHLSDGSPAAGVGITLYRYDNQGALIDSCAQGKTDNNGEADFTGVDIERCYAGAQANQAPEMGVVATEGADVATLQTQSYGGVYQFDVNGGWSSGAPLSRGTIFPDRDMYQPGERGEITGVAYYVSNDRVLADRNASYDVTLKDPSGNVASLGTAKTDAYGIFTMPLTFAKQQALGYYTVTGKGANGNEIDGGFRVAQFKPPNFKLTLSLNATSAQAGGNVQANASAAYLFGAPLEGGSAHAYVTRELAYVQPKGWDDYVFGRQWFYPEPTPSFDTDVLQRDLPLDAQGDTSLNVTVPRDLPFPMTYTVDMETTDVSNLSVSDSKSFLALPGDGVIGISSDTGGVAGKPMPLRVIVTDADGHAVAGRGIHLVLQKMTYTSATQEVEGGESAQQAIEYQDVGNTDVTSSAQPVTAQLTPPDPGPYRVVANFAGAQGDASSTDAQVFAFGPGEADWGLSDPNAVAVKLDKKSYAIGDTATALVASPYADSDIYVAVVRGDALYRATLRGVTGAKRIAFKITPAMLPNAAFEAVVVRRGANVASAKPGTVAGLARVGMASFSVDTADRYLKLAIAPKSGTVRPGGSQHVDFTLTHKDGSAARGELVAIVVNDAILQLSGYRPPDLVETVFQEQPISTTFSDNREEAVLQTQTPPPEKGFGYGGGYLAGAGSTRVRQHFLPLAYYKVLQTDASGKAGVSFSMPDDLTTWRVMAVAIADDDAHFVTSDATFVSALPLISNPLLPQFARPGDHFGLGVSVSNQTGAGGALDLVLQLTGALAFASGNPSRMETTEQAATGTQGWRFPVVAGTPAPTAVEATSRLGSQSDAFKVPFGIVDRGATDAVIDSGATASHVSVPIDLSRPSTSLGAGSGFVQITLANSIVPQFVVPTQSMMNDDPYPFADDLSSRLEIASALQGLRAPYRLKLSFDPGAQIAVSLQKLYALQRGDGGFAQYDAGKSSEPFATAYVVEALAFAQAHGVAIDSSALARAKTYLGQMLANPARYTWCDEIVCKTQMRFEALWALAAAGSHQSDFLSDVVAHQDAFESADKIRLARLLLQTPGWQSQGAALADRLQQTVYVTGRYSTANVSTRWGWLGTRVVAQAQMLQLLIERHAPSEQLDGAVRELVAQQCRCGWPTIDDAATALVALTAYAGTEHLSSASATVTAGGARVASAQFGNVASSQSVTLPANSLKGGALDLSAQGGTIHYTVLYSYPVAANAPGELAAFRVVRTVQPPGGKTPIATMDLAPAPSLDVDASKVFDVGIRVIVDHPVDRLMIEDPLPAGFEAVDTSFLTSSPAVLPQSDSWDIDSQQIYSDRVVAFAEHLGPGVYDVHYLVRSVTPGTFLWPGARAYLRDAPEQFGRSAAVQLNVK
jgi:uncharacterized protein YfaS (alpha-2-macroglobulin family)